MNDPFAIQTREGMDAPDLQVRTAQLKLQAGIAPTEKEIRRLAVRQGLESEVARQNEERTAAGFSPVAPVRVSVNQGLAGTGLDPVLVNARVQAARIASDPVERAKFEQAQELASFGLRATPGTPEAADALVNAKVRASTALNSGLPLEQVDQARLVGSVPTAAPVLAADVAIPEAVAPVDAPVLAPIATPTPVVSLSPVERVKAVIPKEYEPNATDPTAVVDKEFSRRFAGQRMSVAQLRDAKAQIRKELTPSRQTRSITDPLTRDVYDIEVMTDPLGNIYQRGEPIFKSAGPNKKIDEEYQKDVTDWTAGGGASQTRANIQRLQSAIDVLKDPSTVLSSGRVAGLLPESVRKVFQSPRTASAQAGIESVAQESLRKILGAQFTEKEGEKFLARVFDVKMPEEENARRATLLVKTLDNMADTKDRAADYFRQHGTIQGFVGPTSFSMTDLDNAILGSTPANLAPVRSAKDAYLSQFKQ